MIGKNWKTRLKIDPKRINFIVFPVAAIPLFFGITLFSAFIEDGKYIISRSLVGFIFFSIGIFLLYFGTFKSEEQMKKEVEEDDKKNEVCSSEIIIFLLGAALCIAGLVLFIWFIKFIWNLV